MYTSEPDSSATWSYSRRAVAFVACVRQWTFPTPASRACSQTASQTAQSGCYPDQRPPLPRVAPAGSGSCSIASKTLLLLALGIIILYTAGTPFGQKNLPP